MIIWELKNMHLNQVDLGGCGQRWVWSRSGNCMSLLLQQEGDINDMPIQEGIHISILNLLKISMPTGKLPHFTFIHGGVVFFKGIMFMRFYILALSSGSNLIGVITSQSIQNKNSKLISKNLKENILDHFICLMSGLV